MPVATLRRVAAAVTLCLLPGLAGPAAADQTDKRLDPLFAQLKTADGPDAAAPIEAQIWAIWGETADPAARELMQQGVAALAAQDGEAALAAFDRLVKRAPGFAEAWNKRATTLYLLGRYAESVADIATVLKLEPRHFGALSGLGLCDVQLDRLPEAVAAFQRALAVDPAMPAARANIQALQALIAKHSI